MSSYLKNMAGYKTQSAEKKNKTKAEGSSKRAGDELEYDMSKKQKIDEHIDKDGRMGYFKLIRADGSSKRPADDYERVLWGDLKVMFEPDIKSDVWSILKIKLLLGDV
ncbi:hypothetical protein Tco_1069903 [Tanacetum coccineum]|uniref:Uncharacterized protein n=1 Tax=Tanacetum coccineum TaxID=301880 RepID=A0ABQ5HJY6_9ASTR